ncbi:MAG: glycosyltransferase [Anaerolineales bacterium]|nr:glycosyltransferase [Anaerolineales bacterium]
MVHRAEKETPESSHIYLCIPSLRGGGAEGTMVRLANELAQRGYSVELVVVRVEGPWAAYVSDAVHVVDLDKSRVLSAFFSLRKYMRGKSGVFVSNLTHLNIVSIAASRLMKHKPLLFVVEHNDLQIRLDRLQGFIRVLAKRALAFLYRRADQVLAVSRDLAADICRILKYEDGAIRVLHNGLDLGVISNKAAEPMPFQELVKYPGPVIIAIGRLVYQKGFDVLLEAMAIVRQTREALLVVLGEGELRKALETQAQTLGIMDAVRFPGYISNPYPVLKRADLFVLSSHYEGFGIVILEAMACGTPVVATDCHWGPAELLQDGGAGVLVPPGDAPAMAAAILEILEDPARAKTLTETALEAVKGYQVEQVADGFLGLVDRLSGKIG